MARRRDLSVIHAFELVGDVLWMRDRWVEKGASFRAQDDAFDEIWKKRRIASAWIDQTGMGEKVVEDLQAKYGDTRIVGQLLTGPNRLDLATAFKDRVENCSIRVPPIVALRTDYRAIKKEGSTGGAVRIVDDGDVHADEFWATALACRAADVPYQPYDYRGAGRGRGGQPKEPNVSESYLHGVEVVEVTDGVRSITAKATAVIGIVGTAPFADPVAFPLDRPVLITAPGQAAEGPNAVAIPVIGQMRGLVTSVDPGEWGDPKKGEVKLALTPNYYRLRVGGREIYEIDLINGVRRIGGVDQLAGRRAALGL